MNIFHVNNRRGALCYPRVGEWVTLREMDSSVARQVDTPYKQWTLHEYHYIILSYNKYRRLNAGVTDFSNTRENSCVFLHWAIDMLLHFALY